MTRFGSLMLSHPQTRSSLRPARYPGHASGNVFEPSCMRSNLHPYIFGLKVRTRVPRPSIFVRSFSLFTRSRSPGRSSYNIQTQAGSPATHAWRMMKTRDQSWEYLPRISHFSHRKRQTPLHAHVPLGVTTVFGAKRTLRGESTERAKCCCSMLLSLVTFPA